MSESELTYHPDGSLSCASGRDAIELYRAAVLRSSIYMLQHGIKPMRGYTMKRALEAASRYTGQRYKRTESERAREDLHNWIELMKSTIPTRTV